MNPLAQSTFRKQAIAEMGNKLDDSLEEASKDVSRYEGARRELVKAAKGINNLQKTLDGEFEEGKTIRDGMEAKDVRDLCKRWIDRAFGIVDNLAMNAATMEQQAYGKQAALKESVSYAKKLFDSESAKEDAILKALAAENEDFRPEDGPRGKARPSGVHPGMSIGQRRRAEEAAAAASKGNGQKPVEEMSEAELEAELLG